MNASGPTNFNSSPEASKQVGPVIGLIVILAIILIGGIYFWMSRQNREMTYVPPAQEQTETKDITTQGSTTDGASIDADLRAFGQDEIEIDSSL